MKNNNELDQIVESFLKPKSVPALDLGGLFALFEEMKKDGFLLENTTSGKKFTQFIVNAIPSKEFLLQDLEKGIQNELFNQESKDKTLFFENLQSSLNRIVENEKSPLVRLQKIVSYVKQLKEQQKSISVRSISSTFGSIIFVVSLFNMIETFQAQQAGTLFESFFAFLVGGKIPEGQPIGDVIINTDTSDNTNVSTTETWSLKLLSSKTEVKGSITNMLTYFDIDIEQLINTYQDSDKLYRYFLETYLASNNNEEIKKVIYYLIVNKGVSKLTFNVFALDINTFVNMLNKQGKLKAYLVNMFYKKQLENVSIVFDDINQEVDNKPYSVTAAKKIMDKFYKDSQFLSDPSAQEIAKINYEKTKVIIDNYSQKNKAIINYDPQYLQFSFEQNMPGSKIVLKEPLVLELTAEELGTIIKNNMQIFADDINFIIDEINNINYQVANYFLFPTPQNGVNTKKAISNLEETFSKVGKGIGGMIKSERSKNTS
jgi:hypothetical protein